MCNDQIRKAIENYDGKETTMSATFKAALEKEKEDDK